MIGLLRRLRPDFKTIADFRRNNRGAFRQVLRDFVKVCRRLELFGREPVAADGTRIKAVNNRDRNFTEGELRRELGASQERLDRYLQQMNAMDETEAGPGAVAAGELKQKIAALRERRARLKAHRKALRDSGEEQLSLTDPDAQAMPPGTGVGVATTRKSRWMRSMSCRAAGSQPGFGPRDCWPRRQAGRARTWT